MEETISKEICEYYDEKLEQYGDTPQGVDWNGSEGQFLRFKQLCKLIEKKGRFSIADVGCGYGALLKYLHNEYKDFNYTGYDISEKMIESSKLRNMEDIAADFHVGSKPRKIYDYVVASGIFNVKQKRSDECWMLYVKNTLHSINDKSREGFSFNCLTKYSDKEYKKNYLFYADPCELFDYCKTHYSNNVSLLHDYNLYEFSIIVRK